MTPTKPNNCCERCLVRKLINEQFDICANQVCPCHSKTEALDCGPTCLIYHCTPCPCGVNRPTKMNQFIEEQLKLFEEEFGHHREIWNGKKGLPEGMTAKDFLQQSLEAQEKRLKERIESRRKDELEAIGGLDDHDGGYFIMGYNEAIEDILDLLNQQIK